MRFKVYLSAAIAFISLIQTANANIADLNYNGSINFSDLALISSTWLKDTRPVHAGFCGDNSHPEPAGDINGDCIVNFQDLQLLVTNWLGSDDQLSGLDRIKALKNSYFKSEDHEWSRWVVTTASPTRIHFTPWTDAQRQTFLTDYVPDHIDEWAGSSMNRGDFFRMRGIAANTTHEYGANEDLNELRGHSMPTMADNGICREEKGTYADGGWDGSYLMCDNAPKWQELAKQSSGRQAFYGDSIFHDKLETTLRDLDQGYCTWCNRRFIEHMCEYFSRSQLDAMGFDPNTFSLISYVAGKRSKLKGEATLEDPIIHEYIRFQYMDHLYFTTSIIDNYHKTAVKAGSPIPAFYGNQSGNSGPLPYAVALSDVVDIVWNEQSHTYQRPLDAGIQAYSTLVWKLGRAASHYRKAVWSIQYQAARTDIWPYGFGADKKYPTVLALAEATANDGVLVQSWTASCYNGETITDTLLEGHRHHAKFVTQNRGLFVDRTSVVDHAVIYSMPSMFWRVCYKLASNNKPHLTHFTAAARLLEDSHIPYNIVILGHKDVFDDTKDLATLSNYKTLIIPSADCISDKQAEALKRWTRAGGKLVLWARENIGTRDEEFTPRTAPVFNDLVADPGAGVITTINTVDANSYIATGQSATITPKIPAADLIQTTLSGTVWLNVWRHGAGPMMSVQMFNNDVNVAADTYSTVSNFTVTLREPAGIPFTHVDYYNTGYVGTPPSTSIVIPFTRNNGYITVTVPQLDMFGILIFSTDNELQARMAAATARNSYEKLKIALRCPGQSAANYVSLLTDSKVLLNQIQGDVEVADFGQLIAPIQNQNSILQTTLNSVTASVQASQTSENNAATNVSAYRKFDFGESGAPSGWTQVTSTSEYTSGLGYGWNEGELVPGTVSRTETFTGTPDLMFPDNLDLRDWIFENYDTDWGTDLTHATFNGLGQVLLKADKKEACQSIKYNALADVTNWTTEWTIIPVGPAGGGFWGINIMNGASSYGRFQVYFGKNGGNQLLALGGTSGWTTVASTDLGSMPSSIKIRLVWNNSTKKISVYYGLNGADSTISFVSNYTQGTPVGNTVVMFRNMEWDLGTISVPGNHVYTTLLDNWTFQGDLRPTIGTAVNHSYPDALHRDFIRSKDPIDYASGYTGNSHFPYTNPPTNPGKFKVNLPNGDYIVTIITGDYQEFRTVTGGPANEGRTAMTRVEAEGLPVLYGDRCRSGYFDNRAFRTTVSDGQLNLRFSGSAVGPLYCNPIEWLVNAVIIQTPAQILTPAAQAYLAKADLLSASAIRNWNVIGPFDDNDCLGLKTIYGPEQSADRSKSYVGKNSTVSWQQIPALAGSAPYIALNNVFTDCNEVAGFALSHVYCPTEQKAVLVSSISQCGIIYVNNQKVFTDELAVGLLPDEQYVQITLHAGWNSILIKTLNHWGNEWSLWAGLLTQDRRQALANVPGIIISANPGQ